MHPVHAPRGALRRSGRVASVVSMQRAGTTLVIDRETTARDAAAFVRAMGRLVRSHRSPGPADLAGIARDLVTVRSWCERRRIGLDEVLSPIEVLRPPAEPFQLAPP